MRSSTCRHSAAAHITRICTVVELPELNYPAIRRRISRAVRPSSCDPLSLSDHGWAKSGVRRLLSRPDKNRRGAWHSVIWLQSRHLHLAPWHVHKSEHHAARPPISACRRPNACTSACPVCVSSTSPFSEPVP